MVLVSSSSTEETLIYNVKLSSVGPGHITGSNTKHEPTTIDLAMRLHYLKGVYYFKSHEAFGTMNISQIKEGMFKWCEPFYVVCGRFRRSPEDFGRPYIKCNDCGVRLMEAQCSKTIEEWLEMVNGENKVYVGDGHDSLENKLICGQPIGPEIEFSPNIFIQITKFKCGGMSLGLRWAHVLGDVYFASYFINSWGKVMAGHEPGPPPNLTQYRKTETPPSPKRIPLSLKWVEPVADRWIPIITTKMGSFSFHVTATQLTQLQSKITCSKKPDPVPPFESVCAVIWQCVAKVRNGPEPNVVTILKHDSCTKSKKISNNNQTINIVKGECSIANSELNELVFLLTNNAIDERGKIREFVESENGTLDVIVYGANLTFVDFEEAKIYDCELKGQYPVHVSYYVDGIGDGGTVFVHPTPEDCGIGRFVTITLPEKELLDVKCELRKNDLLSIE